ncbi:MAG TPA: hypothetical protein VFC84_01025 [Desulfosporosinus sp.]|nr:hypothetical protein [Desulfosporosinus sp.]
MFQRKMALEKVWGNLEKVAMGIREREKERINKDSVPTEIFGVCSR